MSHSDEARARVIAAGVPSLEDLRAKFGGWDVPEMSGRCAAHDNNFLSKTPACHWPPTPPGVTADRLVAEIKAAKPEVRLVKLPRSAMRTHAVRLLREQGGLCPLCRKEIDLGIKGEGVIDHDHDTGRIRGLLHRSCNASEGKISNAAARWGAKSSKYADIIPYLEALVTYLKREPTQFIYPMHKTPDERKDAMLKKRREAAAALRAKREVARQARLKGPE